MWWLTSKEYQYIWKLSHNMLHVRKKRQCCIDASVVNKAPHKEGWRRRRGSDEALLNWLKHVLPWMRHLLHVIRGWNLWWIYVIVCEYCNIYVLMYQWCYILCVIKAYFELKSWIIWILGEAIWSNYQAAVDVLTSTVHHYYEDTTATCDLTLAHPLLLWLLPATDDWRPHTCCWWCH
jgi:hypothetical protein